MVGKQKTKAAFMVMTERSKGIEIIRKILLPQLNLATIHKAA